jgi:ribosomal protein S12 methylthiotransferase
MGLVAAGLVLVQASCEVLDECDLFASVGGAGYRRDVASLRLRARLRSDSPSRMSAADTPSSDLRAPKVSFVSLGCPKALVDSERIVTRLRAEGYELARRHEGADLVIVNTCGFLDSAQAESLAAIGDALRENGKVIVTGCMGAEPEKITERYPGVLAVTGPQQYESVVEAVHRAVPPRHDPFLDLVPPEGVKLTPRHYAYLKISEGCNNRCTFCIIPKLRGDLVSRPAADVLREAERLVAAGVKELLVISQDTSAYGVDLKYAASDWKGREVRAKFVDLARALGEFGAWVRLHYVYPYPHVDEVIPLMAEGKVLPYLDIPFQHASPQVLKRMRRPAAQEQTLERIRAWRTICPDLTLRSTFIVGFPGETDEDFELLLEWLDEVELDRVGCFRYEPVKGAVANDLAAAVPDDVKEARWHRFMARQQAISARRLKRKLGTRQQVIIDETGTTVAKGRSKGDAPEIDGAVYVASRRPLRVGEIATVKIERIDAYDLHGTAVGF